jgi:hypothetical protein
MDIFAAFTASAAMAGLGVGVLATKYRIAKLKLHEVKELLVELDDALRDDHLSFEEARRVVKCLKTVLGIKNEALVTEKNNEGNR